MKDLQLKQASKIETSYIQLVYDNLNEKCAFDYANALGVTDWQYCYQCAGDTPTSDDQTCAICMINRDNHPDNDQ